MNINPSSQNATSPPPLNATILPTQDAANQPTQNAAHEPLYEIERLEHNLGQLYSTLNRRTDGMASQLLVSNAWYLSRIYNIRQPRGMFWSMMGSVWETSPKNFSRIIREMGRLFDHNLAIIQQDMETYQRYLEAKLTYSVALSAEQIPQIREKLSTWHTATYPILEQLIKRHRGLILFLERHFPKAKGQIGQTVFSTALVKKSCTYQKIIQLEQQLELPYPLLFRLSRGEPPAQGDKRPIAELINDLQRNGVTCQSLHQGLEGLLSAVPIRNGREFVHLHADAVKEGVTRIEYALAAGGWSPLHEPDPHYIQWQQTLRPGATLPVDQRVITLGERLRTQRSQLSEDNRPRTYTLQDNPAEVLVSGTNCVRLNLSQHLISRWNQQYPYLPGVEMTAIHPEGRFALMEKLDPVEEFSQLYLRLSSLDQKNIVHQLILIMKLLLNNLDHPSPFALEHLMLAQNHFKLPLHHEAFSTKQGTPSSLPTLTFQMIENLLWRITSSQNQVRDTILAETRLFEHPMSILYRSLVEAAVTEEEFNLSTFLTNRGISNVETIKQIQQHLLPEIDTHLNNCARQLGHNDFNAIPSKLRRAVKTHFFAHYDKTGCRSRIVFTETDIAAILTAAKKSAQKPKVSPPKPNIPDPKSVATSLLEVFSISHLLGSLKQ